MNPATNKITKKVEGASHAIGPWGVGEVNNLDDSRFGFMKDQSMVTSFYSDYRSVLSNKLVSVWLIKRLQWLTRNWFSWDTVWKRDVNL